MFNWTAFLLNRAHVPFRRFANLSTLLGNIVPAPLAQVEEKAAKAEDNLHDKSVICDMTLTTENGRYDGTD